MNFDTNFNFALNMDTTMDAADPVPLERCGTCQRWGLPILPLQIGRAHV